MFYTKTFVHSIPAMPGGKSSFAQSAGAKFPRRRLLLLGLNILFPKMWSPTIPHLLRHWRRKINGCGITVLCRQPRTINGKEFKDGCNCFKGSAYDRLFRHLFDDKDHTKPELRHRHGVAILIRAYLGAFQTFGYSYIRRNEIDEIREQFDFP